MFYTVQFFFGARLENPKINKQGGPNNSGVGRGEAFIRDLRV